MIFKQKPKLDYIIHSIKKTVTNVNNKSHTADWFGSHTQQKLQMISIFQLSKPLCQCFLQYRWNWTVNMIVHIINNPKQVSMTNAQVNQTLGEKHRILGKHKSFGEKKRKKKNLWGKKHWKKGDVADDTMPLL